MQTPAALKKGDLVAIVSTARKVTAKELQPAIQFLKSNHLQVLLGKSINASYNQFAGDDALRTADFQEQLENPNVKAIWCARGGYGTVRIIDKINFSSFLKNPKWIIGYSDVTVLHSHIHTLGVETMHAQMPVDFESKSIQTKNSLLQTLFGKQVSYTISSLNFNRLGEAKGVLVGGNLSILYSLCGSESALKTDGKILFIEDLDEYLYHIDRMMQNLNRNGMLSNLKGLIVGGMTHMHDNTIPFGKTAEEIILDVCKAYDFPIAFGFPAGHLKDNRALILGRNIKLTVGKEQTTVSF